MTIVLMLFVFVFGAGMAVLAYLWLSKLPERMAERKVEARLRQIQRFDDEETKNASAIVKGTKEGPLPGLERLLGQTSKGSSLATLIEQSGMKGVTVSGVLLTAVGTAALCGILGAVLVRGSYALLIGGALGFVVPFLLLRYKRTARMHKFEEQFPEALDLIARALKAGHAFANGMKMAADELPDPVGPEFRKTFDEQNFGLPLKDALDNLAIRMPLLDVRFFATAVLIQRETGGNLSEILENLAHVVRERFKILRQVRVYTAHGRFTGYVLLALPAFLGVALMFINPDHMNLLFRERMGQMMLGGAAVLQFIGYVWIRQVIKIEV